MWTWNSGMSQKRLPVLRSTAYRAWLLATLAHCRRSPTRLYATYNLYTNRCARSLN